MKSEPSKLSKEARQAAAEVLNKSEFGIATVVQGTPLTLLMQTLQSLLVLSALLRQGVAPSNLDTPWMVTVIESALLETASRLMSIVDQQRTLISSYQGLQMTTVLEFSSDPTHDTLLEAVVTTIKVAD